MKLKKIIPELTVLLIILVLVFYPYRNEPHPYRNYISYEKGEYSLLCVMPDDDFNSAKFPWIPDTDPNIVFTVKIQPIKASEPVLRVKSAPEFIFFDREKIIYRTNSYENAIDYLKGLKNSELSK